MRILYLSIDTPGAVGGIATFVDDTLRAMSSISTINSVEVVPRNFGDHQIREIAKVTYHKSKSSSVWSYVSACNEVVNGGQSFDLIWCSHINLLPVAVRLKKRFDIPLVLTIYGLDAWQPRRKWLIKRIAANLDLILSISDFTKQHFLDLIKYNPERVDLFPCCVDLSSFRPAEKDLQLLESYGFSDKRVLMTLCRLSSAEKTKGVDEVIDLLPNLTDEYEDIVYLVCGSGDDLGRLKRKVSDKGLDERVKFSGYIEEEDKLKYYNSADAYVMPSRSEGFGIVFLEAMACGLPIVASEKDAGAEVVDKIGVGFVVDPDDEVSLRHGIILALQENERVVPDGLKKFSFESFSERLAEILRRF